jgi:hypothetical protein
MLDDVCDEDVFTMDSGLFERLIEQSAGRPNEWVPGFILLVAGRLADQDHRGVGRSFARDRLGSPRIQIASAARLFGESQRSDRPILRQELGGRRRRHPF